MNERPICCLSRIRLGLNEPKIEIRWENRIFYVSVENFERKILRPLQISTKNLPGLTELKGGNGLRYIWDLDVFFENTKEAQRKEILDALSRYAPEFKFK